MQLHQIQPIHKGRRAKRVGRGGKRGTFSGRGTKGQHARAGAKFFPAERELLKKIPKLRGYKFKSFQSKPAIVNLKDIERVFKPGDTVTPDALMEAGLIRRVHGKKPIVKVLGTGVLKKKITFKDVIFSKSAQNKIAP